MENLNKYILSLFFVISILNTNAQIPQIATRMEFSNGQVLKESGQFFVNQLGDSIPAYFIAYSSPHASLNTDLIWAGGGNSYSLDATGIPIGIIDAGTVRTTHGAFEGRVFQKDQAANLSLHATQTVGAILGSGLNPSTKGAAFRATGNVYDWDNYLTEIALEAANGTKIINLSWGMASGWTRLNGTHIWWGDPSVSTQEDYKFGFYSKQAQDIDRLLYQNPDLSVVVAAGNDRNESGPLSGEQHLFFSGNNLLYSDDNRKVDGAYDCLPPTSIPKNVLTVGGIHLLPTRYNSAADIVMTQFSSWGPTDDGRIKPELVAPAIGISTLGIASDEAYTQGSGTSFAAPAVSGLIALLQELYQQTFGKFMRSATVKALLILTASEATTFEGPSYEYGFGLPDGLAAANVISTNSLNNDTIIESSLISGQQFLLPLFLDGNTSFSAAIAWTDPAGTSPSPSLDPQDLMLVNDLDLRVRNLETGEVHFPYRLDPTNPETPSSKGDNYRDNIEKLHFLPNEAGSYVLSVKHKGVLQGDLQDFSLIIKGGSTNTDCEAIAKFTPSVDTACVGQIVTFENQSTQAQAFLWQVDGQLVDTTENFVWSSNDPGFHQLELIAGDSNCTSAFQDTILIKRGADARFRYSNTSSGYKFEAVDNSPNLRYLWSFGDERTDNDPSPLHQFDSEGIFEVCLTIQNDCPTTYCRNVPVFGEDALRRQDSLALVAFKNSTNISSLNMQWDENQPIETWQGVKMGFRNIRVAGLEIRNQGLVGELPSEISWLTALEELDLWGMYIPSSSLPEDLWLLPNLKVLELNNCNLGGKLEPSLALLDGSLRQLVLSHNNFVGPIPIELYALTKLRFLALNGNRFSGTLSPLIANLKSLTFLNLFGNELSGPIPNVFENFPDLVSLILAVNQFSGQLPNSIYACRELVILDIFDNPITGELKPGIANLSKLSVLRAFNSLLQGEIPAAIGSLPNLRLLQLNNTLIGGQIPSTLNQLEHLEEVWFSQTNMQGQLIPFTNSNELKSLKFAKANFKGLIPPEWFQKPHLTEITLDHNQFTFQDIEPIITNNWIENVNLVTYAPQKSIPVYRQGDRLYVKAGSALGDNNYAWYLNGNPIADVKGDSSLLIQENGLYHCVIADDNITRPEVWYSRLNLRSNGIDVFDCDDGCVFPGDANNDAVVNLLDLLMVGRVDQATGPPRLSSATDWGPQASTDWQNSTLIADQLIDYKYADTNGDGNISSSDTTAICINFGRTHNLPIANTLTLQHKEGRSLEPEFVSIQEFGEDKIFRISIRYAEEEPIQGLAFKINYKAFGKSIQEATTDFCFNSTQSLSIIKDDPLRGTVDIGVVFQQDLASNCDQELVVDLSILANDLVGVDTSDLLLIQEPIFLYPDGRLETRTPATINVLQVLTASEVAQEQESPTLHLFPNPTTAQITVEVPDAKDAPIRWLIYDLKGQKLLEQTSHSNATKLKVSHLAPGMYVVIAKHSEFIIHRNFIKL